MPPIAQSWYSVAFGQKKAPEASVTGPGGGKSNEKAC